MDAGREVLAETTENPAATADAEQHARQEIAGMRQRLAGRAAVYARPLVAVAAGMAAAGWLIRRRRRGR